MNERLVVYLMDNETPPAGYVAVCATRGWEVRRGGEVRRVIAWADPANIDIKNNAAVDAIRDAARVQDERRYKAHVEGRYVGYADGSVVREKP